MGGGRGGIVDFIAAKPLLSPHFTKLQWLKHATACCRTCLWGLLLGVLKHAATCRFLGNIFHTKISILSLARCSMDG